MTAPSRFALRFGARLEEGGVFFRVWSPGSRSVELVIESPERAGAHALATEPGGYFAGFVEGVGAGARYRYRLDGGDAFPDPATRYQPEGVHGPSEVVDPEAYRWSDGAWRGRSLEELVIYELHVGTFTPEGTFAAAAERMAALAELGVTAVEVMPIANFPGRRNWGYDGVNLYAPATAYGRPEEFKRLVDTAHSHGLAVILDVVYNHLGPDGNYVPAITHGHYFTDHHHTPWGNAINYDAEQSGPVRDFVRENALFWVHEYHVDGLRLDATHAIVDDSARHILREIAEALHGLERPRLVIAEDERNERRLLLPVEDGGVGLDAVWADDLHHQLRRLAAGDTEGYFAAYDGTVADVVETLRRGWYYEGQLYPPSGKTRGTSAEGIWPPRFVHCLQNHDQVGNRALGERLNHEIPLPLYRALSALLLLSPYTPLLWMGQEWAASTPFLYFTEHEEELGRLVTEGRREEFKHFSSFADEEKRRSIPDPQDPATFERSRLDWAERERGEHAGVLRLYRELLALRGSDPVLRDPGRENWRVGELGEAGLALRRGGSGEGALLLLVLFRGEYSIPPGDLAETSLPEGIRWLPVLATEEIRFGGSGAWGRLEGDGSIHLVGPTALLLRAG
jgi:maltooligosyltrehalose trehalohydrolase